MTNRLNRWMLVLMLLIAVPFWWYLIDAGRSDASPKPVHIADLRALAGIIPGQHPTAVTYTLLASRRTPGDFFAAGIGLKRRPLAVMTWTLAVPGKGPILIDPGAPPPEASVGEFSNFNRAAQSQVDAEARLASLLLRTQGQTGGPPRPTHRPGGRILRSGGKAGIIPAALPATEAPAFSTAQAVAPGVVVISASSHSPGARLIFVQLADGREFLFVGDIATLNENWSELRARSRLAADWGPPQNRAETYAWLRTIRRLHSEAPKLKIVPGHDYLWVMNQRTLGAISETTPGAVLLPKAD